MAYPNRTGFCMIKTYFVKKLSNCARCNGNHVRLTFKELKQSCEEWTYWTTCPNTKEPILMQITPDKPKKKV